MLAKYTKIAICVSGGKNLCNCKALLHVKIELTDSVALKTLFYSGWGYFCKQKNPTKITSFFTKGYFKFVNLLICITE